MREERLHSEFLIRDRFFLVVVGLGCLVHLGMAVSVDLWLSKGQGPALLQDSDEVTYYTIGRKIATAVAQGMPTGVAFEEVGDTHRGYYYLMGALLYGGATPLQVRLMNAGLGTLAPILFLCAMRVAGFDLAEQRIFFGLLMFWPSAVFWTSLIIKEAWVYATTACVWLGVIRIMMCRGAFVGNVIGLALAFLGLSFFRSYAALILLFVVTVVGACYPRSRARMILAGSFALVVVTVINPDVFELFLRALGYRVEFADGYLADIQRGSSGGGSAIPPDIPLFVKMWLFATFPLPWQATSLFQKMAVPEVFLWLVLAPVAMHGLWVQLRAKNPVAFQMAAVVVAFLVLYAYLINNLGTIFRIKSGLAVYFVYFAAVGGTALRSKVWAGVKWKR